MTNTDPLPTKLLWVDLEMTGLDSTKDVILEVAAEVTDFNLKTLASFEAIISHSEETLSAMNEWASVQHRISGLTERIRKAGKPETTVRQEFADFIKLQFGDELAILAGNTIHNDRKFIDKWWPEINSLLHYRMLDVSSFKIFVQGRYGLVFEKKDVHRAFDDIQASIAELQFYLDKLPALLSGPTEKKSQDT